MSLQVLFGPQQQQAHRRFVCAVIYLFASGGGPRQRLGRQTHRCYYWPSAACVSRVDLQTIANKQNTPAVAAATSSNHKSTYKCTCTYVCTYVCGYNEATRERKPTEPEIRFQHARPVFHRLSVCPFLSLLPQMHRSFGSFRRNLANKPAYSTTTAAAADPSRLSFRKLPAFFFNYVRFTIWKSQL